MDAPARSLVLHLRSSACVRQVLLDESQPNMNDLTMTRARRIWSVNMVPRYVVGFVAAAIVVLPYPSASADLGVERVALTIPNGLSGSVGSWSGPGWYIYWPATNNPINGQLHRGPYAREDQCQADLKELRDQEDTQDRAVGISPSSDPDRCAYFDVRPDFDRPS